MQKKFILASASPRRQKLLKDLNITFEVEASDVEEIYPPELELEKVPEYLAKLKAENIYTKRGTKDIIIGADTIVLLGNNILGKPADKAMAKDILQQLSGKKHTVITGVCILEGDRVHLFSDSTDVYFYELEESEIDHYLDHYQPYDKAGSYAIQEWIGKIGIEKIEGDYFNVMGLPLSKLYRKMKALRLV